MNVKEILNQLLTGKDNKTNDIARWSWLITTIVIIIGTLYNALNSGLFAIRDFAESIGIIAGAHGAAVLMKKDSEPPPNISIDKDSSNDK